MKATWTRVETTGQVEVVVQLANTIWTEHYTPIIGKDQVDYMLSTFHSSHAIFHEIDKLGYQYYLISNGGNSVGYIGIRLEEETLFLSKLYILSTERGSGIGSQAIEFLKELALSNQLGKVTLTVNKNNSNSIAAYEKIGFKVTGDVCADIGEGYVMDDYQMELITQA